MPWFIDELCNVSDPVVFSPRTIDYKGIKENYRFKRKKENLLADVSNNKIRILNTEYRIVLKIEISLQSHARLHFILSISVRYL